MDSLFTMLSPFSRKAYTFIEGRKISFKKIAHTVDPSQKHIWFHFASLGEFEQGRTVIGENKSALSPKNGLLLLSSLLPVMRSERITHLQKESFTCLLDTAENAKTNSCC